jgi:hypothetical protein
MHPAPAQLVDYPFAFMNGDNLILEIDNYEIVIQDESSYIPNSADNKFVFDKEILLDESDEYAPSSKHSITVNCSSGESHSCILLASGGASGVHKNSAIIHDNKILVAVSSYVCCLKLPTIELEWRTKSDWATCFGIYHSIKHKCYISHGECEIARLSYSGEIVWQASGKDIFTGDFSLSEDWIEAPDFNDECYRIDIETGAIRNCD